MDEDITPEQFGDLSVEALEVINPRSLLSRPERAFHRLMAAMYTFFAVEEAFFGTRRDWAIWTLLALLGIATEDHVNHWIVLLLVGSK